ncbi:hypothetical protein JVT61DRAFT_12180 [Boletus reticuloceps]|uniref:polynucleotide adenylyltransferase n=1 Tax=Boletus reticuloceps TaxID=495285 RepID=A0A8I3A403_9AGAM|nr:hypothetical protein JVT61DRAFT_12180 [Boletus reticuloceps]
MAQAAIAVPSGVQALPYVHAQNQRSRHASKHRFFIVELSQALFDFVIQLLPTAEEMAVKEDVRKLLERLIHTIEPGSRLLSFGSTANGFSLRNSDMDLCCLIDADKRLSASDLVTVLGDLLERETKFHVKPLPHARIPIVKLSLDPSPGLPSGIACDIGFENRLALENTRLLMCYAMIDPTRVRTLVLFRKKINSPYQGTLSSYGYVLLVIYFLIHVKNPPVLPNLQQMPPLRPISQEETHIGGYNTWFFDDIELLCQHWQSSNTESVAELLIDFFRYYSRDFSYNTGVASIRAGLLKKESKGWQNDLSNSKFNDARERNRFCIEDPFETGFNVARCVTKEGLYQIRGEFMRASRVLAMRPRAILALSQLCEEKADGASPAPPPSLFVPPRLSLPQGSFSAGTSPIQSRGVSSERHSPKLELFEPGRRAAAEHRMPEHMAPKRSQWTSPPPPDASPEHHAIFQDQFDQGIARATAATFARDHSEAAGSDDLQSTRSFNETSLGEPLSMPVTMDTQAYGSRGRLTSRPADPPDERAVRTITDQEAETTSQKADLIRRSHSGPPSRKATNRFSWPSVTYPGPVLFQTSSPTRSHLHVQISSQAADTSTVFYETTATRSRIPQPFPNTHEHAVKNVTLSTYPTSGSQVSSMSLYHLRTNKLGESIPPSLEQHLSDRGFSAGGKTSLTGAAGSPSLAYSHAPHRQVPSVVTTTPHSEQFPRSNLHSPSSSPSFVQLAQRHLSISPGGMKSRSPSRSPLSTNILEIPGGVEMNLASYLYPASYVNYPSTPSSTSMSPSSPMTREQPPCYSSPQPSMHIPVKLGGQSGLKPPMNRGQPQTVPSASIPVNLAGSPRRVTPLR